MRFIRRSIRRKTMAVVLATTLVALLVNGMALLAYEAGQLREANVAELRTLADVVGRASSAALAFNDRSVAQQDLRMLRAREDVAAAAIYDAKGALFARYAPGTEAAVPPTAGPPGHSIEGERIALFRPIVEQGETIGTVYVSGRTGFRARLLTYLAILGGVIAFALGAAWLFSIWLQRSITVPVQHVAAAARELIERRDFSIRAKKTTEDEIGLLVDALNGMLAELEREIGERREAETALRTADRRKDEFLATLAHELRNPLAPIRNSIFLMQRARGDADVIEQSRAVIERQVNQMVRLVDDLLDVSRITTGKLALRRERADLREVARAALEATLPLAHARGIELVADIPAAATPIVADPTRLAQVFINLLNNAVKFSEPRGVVRFAASLDGATLRAHVKDSGIGIAPEVLGRLFDIFAQGDQSLGRSSGGLDVGLWPSRRLVELHGGTLEAKSDGLGRGAEFTVRIPNIALPGPESTPHRAPDAQSIAHGRRRILLVDDNVDFAVTFAAMLRSLGEEVFVEHDGEAGLAAASRLRPEIAFLDIGLPRLNGYELARRLRALPETAHSRLVAVTGWGQPKDRERAREAGFDEHMVKPIQLDLVQAILERR